MHRRTLILSAAALPLAGVALADARPDDALGEVAEVTGEARLLRGEALLPLIEGTPLTQGDTVETDENGLALLLLDRRMRLQLGHESAIELASLDVERGGTLALRGAMVFDRPDDLPPLPLTIATAFGEVVLQGTRLFVGPSRGEYAVFVARGQVEVRGAGAVQVLRAGEGCAMVEGAAPGAVSVWGDARITEAFAALGTTREG